MLKTGAESWLGYFSLLSNLKKGRVGIWQREEKTAKFTSKNDGSQSFLVVCNMNVYFFAFY